MQVFDELYESIIKDTKQYNSFDNLSRIATGKALCSFEEYYLMIDRDIAQKICDENMRAEFSNYADGYRAQMKDWVLTHPLDLAELNSTHSIERHFSSWVLVIGAVVSLLLFLFGGLKVWLSVLVFVLSSLFSLVLSILEKRSKDAPQNKGVDVLLERIKKWINAGVEYSDSLLSKFGVSL